MRDGVEPAARPDRRAAVRAFTEWAPFRNTIMILIGLNGVTLGLETAPSVTAVAGGALAGFDRAILAVFTAEIALRLYGHGWRFFRDPWSVFDFIVIAVALTPASAGFAVLRAFRVLRALRLVSAVPRLRRVVSALLRAVPSIGAVAALLLLVFYVFAVIATKMFGERFPDWFGTIGESMFSLFQIMTLESWSMGIVRPVMEIYPQAWVFFVPFIIASSFTILNLFIAIIVDSLQTLHDAEREETVEEVGEVVHGDIGVVTREIDRLRHEVRALREALDRAP